tara:strand:+ start:598 stop:897 length:300 start_codon:yes stop_codon:yes gene_type:complete
MNLTEGLFVLTVSLSGNYTDLEYVGNFPNCDIAMTYFAENCPKYVAASCLLEEYSNLPRDHKSTVTKKILASEFDFEIKEIQSCGFIGVDTRQLLIKDN